MHELAHVRQLHSLDVLFVELIQIIFWFNPLIYFYKQAIKLNHEYLADESVINTCKDIAAYQQMLLSKVSSNHPTLASSLHFSLTKKRFIMMTKSNSPKKAFIKKFALIPLSMCIAVAFSTKIVAQKTNEGQDIHQKTVEEAKQVLTREDSMIIIRDNFHKNSSVRFGFKSKDEKNIYKNYDELTREEKLKIAILPPPVKKLPTQAQLNSWLDPAKFGVWIDGKRIANQELKNFTPMILVIIW